MSSHDQRGDLDRQVARLSEWATDNGDQVGQVVCEVGSGLSGKRSKLRRILSDPSAMVLVVEYRDRLARFGVEHLEAALSAQVRRVLVADAGETTDDLVRDMIEVLTLMCARLDGRRGARNRAMRAVTATQHDAAGERVEPDRHHVTLPRLGTIHTHETTRKLARRIENGTARLLSATVTCDRAGRWHCAFQVLVQGTSQRPAHVAASAHPLVGVDVGVHDLLVVAASDGTETHRVAAPKPLSKAQHKLRHLGRKAARQHGPYGPATKTKQRPSNRWPRTQAPISKTHVRAANIRLDTLHKTTTLLAQQHQVIAVETLNAAGMRSAGGARKRGLNRALADAALAEVRRMLAYKTHWYSSTLVEADRWSSSSKTCSACDGRKPSLTLAERTYMCEHCGMILDRDLNAAINLARLGETQTMGEQSPADSGSVAGRGADRKTRPTQAGQAGGSETSTPHDTTGAGQTGTAPPQGEAA